MQPLFGQPDLASHLDDRLRKAHSAVDSYAEQAIADDAAGVASKVIAEHGVEPVALDLAKVSRSEPEERHHYVRQGDGNVAISYWTIDLFIPYSGSTDALYRRSSTWTNAPTPQGDAQRNVLSLRIESTEPTAQALNAKAHATLDQLEQLVEYANHDILAWRATFESSVREKVSVRSVGIRQRRDISSGLDFPVRQQTRATSRDW